MNKNKILCLLLLLIIVGSCKAQHKTDNSTSDCTQEYDSTLEQKVYTSVDKMPEFDNEGLDLPKFILSKFRYPKEQEDPQGSVWLVFIVDENGKVRKGRILKKRKEELTPVDKEALRVISTMPKWKPGECNGVRVPVRIIVPIRF